MNQIENKKNLNATENGLRFTLHKSVQFSGSKSCAHDVSIVTEGVFVSIYDINTNHLLSGRRTKGNNKKKKEKLL